jgi:hypothetical protein
MTRVLFSTCLLLAGGLGTAGPAAAQRIDSPYRFLDHGQYLGVFGGHLAAEEGVLRIGPQPGPTMGARWGLRVTGPLTIGAAVAYTPTSRTVRDTVFVAADSVYRELGDASVRLLSAMGILHFGITGPRTWNRLQPFVILGAGTVLDLAGSTAIERDLPPTARYDFGTGFAGQFGGGVAWFPSQRVSIRVDAANMLWKLGAPEAFRRTEAGSALAQSEWQNNFALLAGLSFHF